MFNSLKEKLGKAIGIFSKKVAEESSETLVDEETEVVESVKEEKTLHMKEEKALHMKEEKSKQKESKEKHLQKNEDKKQEKNKEQPKKTKDEKSKFEKHKEDKNQELKDKKQNKNQDKKQEIIEEVQDRQKEKKIFGIFKKKQKEEFEKKLPEKSEAEQEIVEEPKEEIKEKKGLFSQPLIKVSISENKFEELFWDIELALLENNVAVEVIEKIKDDLKKEILNQKFNAFALHKKINEIFNNSISEILSLEIPDLFYEIKKKKPYIIAFIGVNGSGKTTSLAKVANLLKEKGYSVVIAACDTFRAAALQQIEEHANNLNIKLIKHDYGSDAAAVAFDAIKHAEAKKMDVVLIDTAGRSHSNINLMDELKKVIRISKPDMKIFVGDSLTGNDVVEQAKSFNSAVGIDALILSKMDIDEKGGASISVSYVTKKPIIFTGSGQSYKDIELFDKEKILRVLNL